MSVADAVVEHRHAMHLRGFWRQHFNYGRGAFTCRRLEASRGAGPFRIEPVRFYFELLSSPFRSEEVPRGRLRVAALLFLSQAANALGFFRERFRRSSGEPELEQEGEAPSVGSMVLTPFHRRRQGSGEVPAGPREASRDQAFSEPDRKSSTA